MKTFPKVSFLRWRPYDDYVFNVSFTPLLGVLTASGLDRRRLALRTLKTPIKRGERNTDKSIWKRKYFCIDAWRLCGDPTEFLVRLSDSYNDLIMGVMQTQY